MNWLHFQIYALRRALLRMSGSPLSHLMSLVVMGVVLSLPGLLYLLVANLQQISGELHPSPELTVFLVKDHDKAAVEATAKSLMGRVGVDHVDFIAKDRALKEILERSGMNDFAGNLGENPLPDAFVVTYEDNYFDHLESEAKELRQLPEVDHVLVDGDWLKRLRALTSLASDMTWLLTALLLIALVAVIGNTVRLQILTQREEIEISRLIGATDAFIRQPFLYFGMLQGLLGGLIALGVIAAGLALVNRGIERISSLYGSQTSLRGFSVEEAAALVMIAVLVGLIAAFVAVTRYVRSQH